MVMLDLEETCIDTWESMTLLDDNLLSINAALHNIKTDLLKEYDSVEIRVGIFSFAIWNQQEKEEFFNKLHTLLSNAISNEISKSLVFTLEEIKNKTNARYLTCDSIEYFQFNTKQDAFIKWARNMPNVDIVALIDDSVTDEVIMIIGDRGNTEKTIYIRNIDKLNTKHRPSIL